MWRHGVVRLMPRMRACRRARVPHRQIHRAGAVPGRIHRAGAVPRLTQRSRSALCPDFARTRAFCWGGRSARRGPRLPLAFCGKSKAWLPSRVRSAFGANTAALGASGNWPHDARSSAKPLLQGARSVVWRRGKVAADLGWRSARRPRGRSADRHDRAVTVTVAVAVAAVVVDDDRHLGVDADLHCRSAVRRRGSGSRPVRFSQRHCLAQSRARLSRARRGLEHFGAELGALVHR